MMVKKKIAKKKRGPNGAPLKCTEVQIEAALRKWGAQLYLTASKLGINYNTLWACMKRWPNLRKVVKEVKGTRGDRYEGIADKCACRAGTSREMPQDQGMVKFLLKTQFKNRGYTERTEVRHGGDAKAPPIKSEQTIRYIDELDLPFDINRAILEAARKKSGTINGQIVSVASKS